MTIATRQEQEHARDFEPKKREKKEKRFNGRRVCADKYCDEYVEGRMSNFCPKHT